MQLDVATPLIPTPSKAARVTGYVLGALPVLMLLMSAFMKLSKGPQAVEGFTHFGFTEGQIVPIGIVELICTILYIVPQTSVLGAILLTGYLGGATVTHVRAHEWAAGGAVTFGVLLWLSLFLRDLRLRVLIPFRSKP